MPHSAPPPPGARLVAHRGYPRRYPENTMPGLLAAVAAGARYVEFDVQLCADGAPVLLHDSSLLRTAGVAQEVFELSLQQLQALEAGEPARFANTFSGVRIPTLTEAVAALAPTPRITAFVELKRESLRRHGREATVDAVLQAVAGAANPCVIISFDEEALFLARARGATAIGWALPRWSRNHLDAAAALVPQYLFCRISALPAKLPPAPWRWVVYETSEPALANWALARGADLVETDAIAEMVHALEAPQRSRR